jgi:hypothetical protein
VPLWKMVCRAVTEFSSVAVAAGAPSPGLRSKQGKLALAMSTRSRWPALKTWLVAMRSIVAQRSASSASAGSPAYVR